MIYLIIIPAVVVFIILQKLRKIAGEGIWLPILGTLTWPITIVILADLIINMPKEQWTELKHEFSHKNNYL